MVSRQKTEWAFSFLLAVLLLLVNQYAFGQKGRVAKVSSLYSCLLDYKIECPKTVLAIAIFETGWLECKNCTYQYNNLFGFRANHDYLRFKSTYECIEYLKIWQQTYYDPWKAKHPKGSYYEFLVHVKYAHLNMPNYLRIIKSIERLVSKDLKEADATLISNPGEFQEYELDTLKYQK